MSAASADESPLTTEDKLTIAAVYVAAALAGHHPEHTQPTPTITNKEEEQMSHQLITGIPGSGLTTRAKDFARDAVERGETVIIATRPHHTPEWNDVSGVTVSADADGVLTMAYALITDRCHRRAYDETPLTVILDGIYVTEWDAVESIVRLGRQPRVTLVMATSHDVPLRVKDNMQVEELEPATV
ncbi:Uncharacterised protein [Mycobacteroides abscessus subsp. abscessus]|uniref:hypothetical protein n=1 Tax=Mycobacteroides abscessus TaxID=36809 RepID=UPI0009A8883E|nr:hypothetical protein [Mycobacteroides abscessus]SLH66734.1 Uncharacterised protein [Mycobacteroides abscessus subsp. abscessus]